MSVAKSDGRCGTSLVKRWTLLVGDTPCPRRSFNAVFRTLFMSLRTVRKPWEKRRVALGREDFVKNPTKPRAGTLTTCGGLDRVANLSSSLALPLAMGRRFFVRGRGCFTACFPMTSDSDPEPGSTDDRSSEAKAFDISSRVFSAALSIGLLAWGGHWLDKQLGWRGPLLILGVLLGFAVFLQQLMSVVALIAPSRSRRSKPGE